MHQERNTLLKLNSTGEYITGDGTAFHLTMDRGEARPFSKDEVKDQEKQWNQKLDQEEWLIQLWKATDQPLYLMRDYALYHSKENGISDENNS